MTSTTAKMIYEKIKRLCFIDSDIPSRHKTLKQRHINADATSYDVVLASCGCSVLVDLHEYMMCHILKGIFSPEVIGIK